MIYHPLSLFTQKHREVVIYERSPRELQKDPGFKMKHLGSHCCSTYSLSDLVRTPWETAPLERVRERGKNWKCKRVLLMVDHLALVKKVFWSIRSSWLGPIAPGNLPSSLPIHMAVLIQKSFWRSPTLPFKHQVVIQLFSRAYLVGWI
jgi:hypothetical protein